jgi:vitamin B12 transporter
MWLSAAAAFPCLAQNVQLHEIVVTATRSPAAVTELVSDVTVIDRDRIEVSAARTLPELLARTAGLQMSANGGLGKSSSVFIRGTEARHAILLVDGVRLGSATLGTPSWDNIPLESIERIEVLKGPASALYGSDAVGGVVQVFLRKGRAGFHPNGSVTAGSRQHLRASAGLQAGEGDLDYSLGVQRLRERGFSATNPRVLFGNHNPDADPFSQTALDATVRYGFARSWSIDGAVLYAEGLSAFDDGPGRNAQLALRDLTAHARVKGQPAASWRTELQVGQGRDTSSSSSEARTPGSFRTIQSQWSWQNHVESPLGLVLAGLEQRVQRIDSTTNYAVRRRAIDAVFAGLSGQRAGHQWQLNLRHDRNSQFGASHTGFLGYGYRITPAWRVHASHGTSFVAPSFNQLYFPGFGNALLQPERGRNTDLGLAWAEGGHEVTLVRFDNRIRGFITSSTTPANIPRARIEGWTLGYGGEIGRLGLHASFDRLDPRNEVTGQVLPRRARSQATLGADYAVGSWRFGFSVLGVGRRFDDAANTRVLAGQATADAYAEWQLASRWSAQLNLNNLANRHYETAFGYNQPGRGVFLTVRWSPR